MKWECEECYLHNSFECNPKKCPSVGETWTRIKELDLKDENGLITRYTLRNSKGEEKYLYWKDIFKEMYVLSRSR